LHRQLENALTKERNARDRERLLRAFPALADCVEPHYLALRQYVDHRPERFFDESAYRIYLSWLNERASSDGHSLRSYLQQADGDLNRALVFLREVNADDWHDRTLRSAGEYDLVRFIDRTVHPTYVRLAEGVLTPLTKLLAFFSRTDAGKGTEGLDTWQIVQELRGGPLGELVAPYSSIIRNGIGHGGITYLQDEIRYRDKKGNEATFSTREAVGYCDDLLDTCNALAAALRTFLLVKREDGYAVPRELLVEELQAETWAPWWDVDGCVESQAGESTQLIIYARADSAHRQKLSWSAAQTGILGEYFAPGYDRYFLSFRRRGGAPGWAAFDGNKMRELRQAGADDISQYSSILDDSLLYIPGPILPAAIRWIDSLREAIHIQRPMTIDGVRTALGRPLIDCRSATAHRNAWGAVVRGEVVVTDVEPERTMEVLRANRRRILRAAVQYARRESKGILGAAHLPVGFAQISIFRRDHRQRKLAGFGLGEDLIGTIRLHRIRRIKSPDIMGSTVETLGKWRFAWNRAWLVESGQAVDALE